MHLSRTLSTVLALSATAALAAGCSSAADPSPVPAPTSAPAVSLGAPLRGTVAGQKASGYTLRTAGVYTTRSLGDVSVPAGQKAVLIRTQLASNPADRSSTAPPAAGLLLQLADCGTAGCRSLKGASQVWTEKELSSGVRETAQGEATLAPGTLHYRSYWQFLPEAANLSGAMLCTSAPTPAEANCVSLGPVSALTTDLEPRDLP